jgi:hypothetical protein
MSPLAIEGRMWMGIGVHESPGVDGQQPHGRVHQWGLDIQGCVSGKVSNDDHPVVLFLPVRLTET